MPTQGPTAIGAAQVYGSDALRASSLRSFVGGKMKMDNTPAGPMLPRNTGGLPNDNASRNFTDAQLFLAGGTMRGPGATAGRIPDRMVAGRARVATPVSDSTLTCPLLPTTCRRPLEREPPPGSHAEPVCAGAQPAVHSAEGRQPVLGRRAAVPSCAARCDRPDSGPWRQGYKSQPGKKKHKCIFL